MQVIPKTAIPQADNSSTQQSPRDRAISAFNAAQGSAQVQATPAEVLVAQAAANTSKQPDTSESAAEATSTPAAATPAEEPLSNQYAILARKEKQLRAKAQAQDQAIKAREAQIAAKEAELQAKATEYETGYVSRARLKSEALAVLAEEGVPYDELTNQILNTPKTDPVIMAQIQRLEAKLEQAQKAQEEANKANQAAQTQQYQEALKQIERDTTRLVDSDPNFEAIKATGRVKDVVSLIEKTFQADKILLTVEEAAQLVEDELVERYEKIAKLGKIQKRLHPAPAQAAAPAKQSQETQKNTTVKTLTNSVGTSRQLSARERAVLAFKGELK